MAESNQKRNQDLYCKLRKWACANVNHYRSSGDSATWRVAVESKARAIINCNLPLCDEHVRSTVESLANWAWDVYSAGSGKCDPAFSEIQRQRGRLGGRPSIGEPWEAEGISRSTWYRRKKRGAEDNNQKRRAKSDALAARAKTLRTEGRTQSEIASMLGISQPHVSRLLLTPVARNASNTNAEIICGYSI